MKWNNLILAGLIVQALASPAAAQDLYRSIELGPNLTIQTYPNLLNEDLLLRPKFLPIGRMPDLMTPPDRVRSATARDYTPPAQIPPYAFCVGRAAMPGPAKADFRFCNATGQELTFILSIEPSTITLTIPPSSEITVRATGNTTATGSFNKASGAFALQAGSAYTIEEQSGAYVFAAE